MDNRLLGPTKCPQILAQQRQRDKHYLDSIATSISRLQLNILDSLDHLNRSDDRWRRGLVSKTWTIHQKDKCETRTPLAGPGTKRSPSGRVVRSAGRSPS